MATPSEASEAALPPEVLGHMFSSLPLPGLGRTRAVCSRWRDAGTLVAGPLWRQQAERLGYLYGLSETAVSQRARGDWRAFVKRELDLERCAAECSRLGTSTGCLGS